VVLATSRGANFQFHKADIDVIRALDVQTASLDHEAVGKYSDIFEPPMHALALVTAVIIAGVCAFRSSLF
jgi:hypothetical protein